MHILRRGLAVAEHDRTGLRMEGDVVEEDLELVLGTNHVHNLADGVRGVVPAVDLGLERLLHPLRRQLHHAVGERCRVEHRRTPVLRRQTPHDAADIRDEPHVEHAVRLVYDERIHLGEIYHMLIAEIQQTSRRGDKQIDGSLLKLGLLALVVHAAVHRERTEIAVLADCVRILAYLDDQLARGGNDQRTRTPPLACARVGRSQIARENRDEERSCLAGPGLGLACDVLAVQRILERKRLDFGAILESEIGDSVHHFRRKIKIVEAFLPLSRRNRKLVYRP